LNACRGRLRDGSAAYLEIFLQSLLRVKRVWADAGHLGVAARYRSLGDN